MKRNIDLNAELRVWFGGRLSEVLGDNPDNIHRLTLDIRIAHADIFRLLYDYQVRRQWPHADANTAAVLCIERSTVWRMQKKKRGKKQNAALCNKKA